MLVMSCLDQYVKSIIRLIFILYCSIYSLVYLDHQEVKEERYAVIIEYYTITLFVCYRVQEDHLVFLDYQGEKDHELVI